ncbi:MAG TPA: hypothetical protein VFA94_06415 [Acidimicrobiales bacterium]|nr:hypothetical protein [Acidimicrobiales bacterium]
MALVLAAVCLGGLVVQAVSGHGQPSNEATAAKPSTESAQAVATYYADLRQVMSPLLVHDGDVRAALRELSAATTAPDPSLAKVADGWAYDVATTRDLIGRLPPPAAPNGQAARDLYHLGTMVYLEATRGIGRVVGMGDQPEGRREAVKSLDRLALTSDRIFDAAKRLLDHDGLSFEREIVVQRDLPSEVPRFGLEGLAPNSDSGPSPGGSGWAGQRPSTSPGAWQSRNSRPLERAVSVLDRTSAAYGKAPLPPTLPTDAAALDAIVGELDGPVPSTNAGAEGTFDIQLALLVHAESLRTLTGGGPGAVDQARRLRLVADRLWSVAVQLLGRGSVGLAGLGTPSDPELDAALLLPGGAFSGKPPPLKPGDPPGTGVPGGLPPLDPSALLR